MKNLKIKEFMFKIIKNKINYSDNENLAKKRIKLCIIKFKKYRAAFLIFFLSNWHCCRSMEQSESSAGLSPEKC